MGAPPPVYSQEERTLLIRIAHQAIEAQLAGRKLEMNRPSDHLAEMRAAFTTLHIEGRLRGCVGFVAPVLPLYRTIAETAVAAAFEDNRFEPVSVEEAPLLKVEISVLSPLVPIKAEDVEVGVHGLVISHYGRRGLLLPQVPEEYGWDRETFLAQTCRKAGLPSDTYLRGATIEAFTAEVFSE